MLLCSVVMALGTSVGGEKIIKSVGMDMVKLERYQGFSADLAGRPLPALFQPVRYPRIHHPYENQRHHGRGRGKAHLRHQLRRCEGDGAYLGVYLPGCGLISFVMAKLFMFIF